MAVTEAQIIAAVEKYCNIVTSSTAVTEYFDGGHEDLIVKVGPIISITSITDMKATQTTSDDTVMTSTAYNFYPERGMIYRYDGSDWNEGRRRWKVSYVAGLGSIPADLQMAVDMWLDYLTSNASGALKSYKTGDDSETYLDVRDMPRQVKAVLDKYKRTVFIH